jgi:hypothetical protein
MRNRTATSLPPGRPPPWPHPRGHRGLEAQTSKLRTRFLYQQARAAIHDSAIGRRPDVPLCVFYCRALGRCVLQKPNLKAFPFG